MPEHPQSIELRAELHVRAADGEDRRPRFRAFAYSGQPIRLANFYDPVLIDLDGVTFSKSRLAILADHDPGKRVGVSTRQRVNSRGVFVEGEFLDNESANEIRADAGAGFPFQVSIGAEIVQAHQAEAGDVVKLNGAVHDGPLVVCSACVIREISVVSLGADDSTSLQIAASNNQGDDMPDSTPSNPQSIEASRERMANEELRVDAIRSVAARYEGREMTLTLDDGAKLPLIQAKSHAIKAGMSADQFELLCRRHEQPAAPAIHASAAMASIVDQQVLEGALLLKAGYQTAAEKTIGANVLDRADKLRGHSLVELCRLSLQASGMPVPIERSRMIRASLGASTHQLVNALGGSIDKLLGVVFSEAGRSWEGFAAVRPLSNFRSHSIISPEHRGQLEELGADGNLVHGTMSEDTSTLQLDTFGKMLALTRKEIFSDDLSIFDDISRNLAIQANRKLNDVVYEVLLDNASTQFTTARANEVTGASSALSIDALVTAVEKMRKQVDADNNDLDIMPAVLLCPPELEARGREILNSTETRQGRGGSSTVREGIANPIANFVSLAVEPRLSNSNKFSNTSTTAWFLFAGPASGPMYVGGLDGMLTPQVESFGLDADPNKLVFSWRVYADYGAAMGEYRAGVRAAGA